MVSDSEKFAEQDKARRETVEASNRGESFAAVSPSLLR